MSRQPARVTVVAAPACHLCEDAQTALAALAQEHPLTVRLVPAESQAGQALLHQHGSGMFPLVLVEEVFFSAGRLPRRKLARLLAGTAPARTGAR
jgi:hypothetical protein